MKRFAFLLAAAAAATGLACGNVEGDLGAPSAGEPAQAEVATEPGAAGPAFGTSKQALTTREYEWFLYKCHVWNVSTPFGAACFTGEAYCTCAHPLNWHRYPCTNVAASRLTVTCDNR